MVLELNFGTNLGKREKGLQWGDVTLQAWCCLQTVWLALEWQRDWNRLHESEERNTNNLSTSCNYEAHALPFGAEWSQIPDFQF